MPPPIEWADVSEWSIGTPDLIVSSPVMTVPAVGADSVAEIGPVPTGLTEDRYIKAVEVKEVRLVEVKEGGGLSNFSIHHIGVHIGEDVPAS